MAGEVITYQEIFGAAPGDEIQESHGLSSGYRVCPAALALKRMLNKFSDIFPMNILGGQSNKWDEFNRHHAGLAVDIMLKPSSTPEVILGQNLLMILVRHRAVIKWNNSVIYQHDQIRADGQYFEYAADDHLDHIHIDWHSPSKVEWFQPIEFIPWRSKAGVVKQLTPKQKPKIASKISWGDNAQNTAFEKDANLLKDLETLADDHRQLKLERLVIAREANLAKTPN